MPSVVLVGHIVVGKKDLAAVLAELSIHIELTQNEKGCLRFEVTQHPEDEHVFSVYEEFVDRTAFEAHQYRVRNSEWGRITTNVERHYRVMEKS